MSKKISNLFTNGRHIIISEMAKVINTPPSYAKQATTTTECTSPTSILQTDISVPLHSFKFIAALQHAAGQTNRAPLLLRHHLKAGHGTGKPTRKIIEEASERFAFMMTATGTKFRPRETNHKL